ncbi:cAMP-dependent protein kinase catalytic subunit [Tieghemiomyces parasiticus]|uniref:cAMP-dependent protein kinase n=1 Tax=Tieghemiomyces parasiticus TaxID=78921 RepID=A0A9W8A051_9FUNG|nr:cAMP-dependent protein kinase catalytic subunit [Tieghemiomyces parasiticus]
MSFLNKIIEKTAQKASHLTHKGHHHTHDPTRQGPYSPTPPSARSVPFTVDHIGSPAVPSHVAAPEQGSPMLHHHPYGTPSAMDHDTAASTPRIVGTPHFPPPSPAPDHHRAPPTPTSQRGQSPANQHGDGFGGGSLLPIGTSSPGYALAPAGPAYVPSPTVSAGHSHNHSGSPSSRPGPTPPSAALSRPPPSANPSITAFRPAVSMFSGGHPSPAMMGLGDAAGNGGLMTTDHNSPTVTQTATATSASPYIPHLQHLPGSVDPPYPPSSYGHQASPTPTRPAEVPARRGEDVRSGVGLEDFRVERTLGTGSFGRVRLVQYKKTGQFYAMKVLKKTEVVRAKQVEHVNNERNILSVCNSPFLVTLLGAFQDNVNLYMVMEYVVGGELFTYLRKYQRFPPQVAKFYTGEVVLAFEYLHSMDIIYRDLKPENVLIDQRGHVKLTDFGFAKHVPDITWTLCGTPDYLAPEIIQSKGYGKAVDWYSLGVLIFEMLAGYPPFYDEDHFKLYEKILAGRIAWPAHFDPLAKDLVRRLLTADLSKRFGNLKGGSQDIKSHRWLAEIDWNKLYNRQIPAPLIPQMAHTGDASNFDLYPETNEVYGDYVAADPYRPKFPSF